jgi:hypothetical protein
LKKYIHIKACAKVQVIIRKDFMDLVILIGFLVSKSALKFQSYFIFLTIINYPIKHISITLYYAHWRDIGLGPPTMSGGQNCNHDCVCVRYTYYNCRVIIEAALSTEADSLVNHGNPTNLSVTPCSTNIL